MNAVICPEIRSSRSEDRQCPGHPQGSAQGHADTRQLTERRNHVLKKQPPSAEGKNVLQLRLQQRRTREQLADQGIMPHPASAGSSVEAQLRLKRARLAEELNEKLALRPGPLELVHKNIIPLDSGDTVTVNHGKFPKQEDSYAFEEDSSSESLSPEQHHSDESQGSACPSSEAVGSAPSSSSSPALTSPRQGGATRDPPDQSHDEGLSGANNSLATPPIPVPAIVKSKTSDKNRHKKPKDVKPKVKKLKYHQYIPPDQKAEKSPPPMDSAYARLLQQQQLFLQLQILSQQKHSHAHPQQPQPPQQHAHTPQAPAQQRQPAFSYQPHPTAQPHKGSSEQISACGSSGPSSTVNSNSSSPVKSTYANQSNISPVKPGPLPANLDDLKVSELRQHLRIRGMPVSGTKTALIERLRPFKDSHAGSSPSGSSDITTVTFPVTPTGSLSSYQSPSSSSALSQGGYYPYPSTSSTPPISPASSELSLSGSLPDSFSDVPMSSPTQFALQPSPAQLGMEDGLGGVNPASAGQEGGFMDGLDAEKDKMLVEKQKVIEELTWKLHQEQRQVEELKMQLHKRKRCYGATQDTVPPPSHPSMHHQHTPAMMGQPFFGVTIKQEPMSLSSSCPLSSPKQLKSPSGSCMEDMGQCNAAVSNLGGPVGPQCMDTAASSGSPSAMSAFISAQCSPQDSPNGKPSSSPQPPSPNNPYLLSPPPLGRDSCGHLFTTGNTRVRSMQIQQKCGGPAANCSYTSDQRGLQADFPNSVDCGLNHSSSAKAGSQNVPPKMSVLPSPRHVGQKSQVASPAFSSSDSDASDLRQPPCYEDAVKQQLTRSQQMDELLDVLIESGGYPGLLVPRCHRHYEHLYPAQPPYGHSANHITESHLETLLGSPAGRGGELALLKMATEDGGLDDEGYREGEGYGSPHNHHRHPHHPPQEKLVPNRDQMDTPLSPICAKVSAFPEVQGMVSETPWETMEWLDLMPPSSASVPPPSGPSIFNSEFLDDTDINLNSAMDLPLEHW
ncbi:myocardin isoform X2 [Scophthalmus maximus]|uniref:myocardin isoform X2 n=1 Tax=Scophthalmus maximus TaxID=52904 RepID=UPI001FA838A2|nr:myocardin isoform X2 [Scophthalmus maximus]